jgi:cyclophilin family peptidyl-prolyl cis-trans isomerase
MLVAFAPGFPKLQDTDQDAGRILIELAPVNDMPHAVYWFLEQVTHELYNGCSFHRNAGHVMQGGPAPNFKSPPSPRLAQRFKDSRFPSILFQEYSANFPHVKYTMGLAGRPGGPDFYVSTNDNSRLHGPGGQTSYEDPSEADSCFAKIVQGTEIIDRMQLGPVKPGGYKALVDNVAIISMRLLSNDE